MFSGRERGDVVTSLEMPGIDAIERAFREISSVLPPPGPTAGQQFFALDRVEHALRELRDPLDHARRKGGLLNPWALVGLKRDEVRTAAALAGLWLPEFGGEISLKFLAAFLMLATGNDGWALELRADYRVDTERSPLGDRTDRVDLIVETQANLVAIEVKIDAGLGERQLDRYLASVRRQADLRGLTPHVVLLAPYPSLVDGVRSATWRDVATASRQAIGARLDDRTLVEQLIGRFGDHVSAF